MGIYCAVPFFSRSQTNIDSLLPVRGLCIVAPQPGGVDAFVKFITDELAPRKVNTLILRVDWNYQYTSHPELRDSVALSRADVKKIVEACKRSGIRVIPQINLLGHQSWASTTYALLRVYPQFDETPHVKMPAKYSWPNPDGLYCKSYCPLHPDVHKIVFELVDEVCDAFESNAFHAGMDEVFYLGDDKCPRCAGRDKAELFAGEVWKIRNHLASKNRELWIWGDRLIDGKTTGYGIWEASYNYTYRAIDMVPKDIMICDWHYERADKSPVYFAMKGLRVATSPWRNPALTVKQVNDMVTFRKDATPQMKDRFQGMVQTVWTDAETFLRERDAVKQGKTTTGLSQWASFDSMFKRIDELASGK
ncbi:MAG: family 20 glycosylhydrolase [Chitinophagaceae bacterium]|nr:family 20 glycosylhydrolase [Chitinophagaceae bacterium]